MDRNIGTSAVTKNNTSLATVTQTDYFIRKWVSPVLNQTSVAANTWTLHIGRGESNSNARFPQNSGDTWYVTCYIWKPSNGTKYGNIIDGTTSNNGAEVTQGVSLETMTGSAVSSLTSGDAVIVFELWARVTQTLATAYTQSIYYDGRLTYALDASGTDVAAYIETPENLSLGDTFNQTKFYLHDTTSGLPTGTLPSSEQSTKTVTANCNFEGSQTTNRLMDTTIGTSQASRTLATPASVSASTFYVSRWVSPALNETSVPAMPWRYNFAARESNTSANFPVTSSNKAVAVNIYVWKPSNGSKYGTILDGNTNGATVTEGTANQERSQDVYLLGSAVSSLTSGDAVIVFEVWFSVTQGSATSYNDDFFYDGTTETNGGSTVSNHASYLQALGDTFSIGAAPQNYTRTMATETVSVSETLDRVYGANRAPASETVSISEAVARAVTNTRTLSDTTSISESLQRQYGANRSLATETVTISENQTRVYGANRSLATETVVISEALATLQALTRVLSDTVPISENLARVYGANRPLSDTVIVTELLQRSITNTRALTTETVTIGELLSRTLEATRSLQDTVIITEDLQKTFGVIRVLSDTVDVSEALDRIYGSNRSLQDTVSITEDLSKVQALVRTLSDTVIVSENLDRTLGAIRSLATEIVTISENLDTVYTPQPSQFTRDLSDTVVISENLARSIENTRAISENVPISELLVRNVELTRALIETVIVSESLDKSLGLQRAITETVEVNETLTRIYEAVRNMIETIVIDELLEKQQTLTRSEIESISISDTITRSVTVSRAITEVVDILDSLSTVFTHLAVKDFIPLILTDLPMDIGKLVKTWIADNWSIGDPDKL